jgi:hypothetical protein
MTTSQENVRAPGNSVVPQVSITDASRAKCAECRGAGFADGGSGAAYWNETADAIEKLEAENSEWAAKSIERESHLAIANADNERLRAALQEIATIDVGAGNMVRPLSRTDFMVAFGTARQVACEALGSADAGSQGEHICGNTRCNVRHELCRV